MNWGIFQGAFPIGLDLATCLQLARDAGFEGVELSLEDPNPLLPEAINETTEAIKSIEKSVGLDQPRPGGLRFEFTNEDLDLIREQAEIAGIRITSISTMQLFYYPLSSSNPAVRERSMTLVRKMIDAAYRLGGDLVLIAPGMVTSDQPYQEVWRHSQETLSELIPYAQDKGIQLGIENVWSKFLLSPLEFSQFIDSLESPIVGAYFDVANVMTFGYPDQWIECLGNRLKRVHFKDYRLDVDDIRGFTNLLQGDVPWVRVVKALEHIGYDGWIIVEVAPYRTFPEQVLIDSVSALKKLFPLRSR
jgi:L-ribulose-5-phosphate 3-epimerase